MAKIIKTREATGELFPTSLMVVSDDLYRRITGAVEKQCGPMLKKITKDKIAKMLHAPLFRDIIITTRKRTIFLPVTVIDISFPPSCEYGLVTVCLLFPLYGQQEKIEKLLVKIAEEVGLIDVSCAGYGMEVKITLVGEDMPCQITPNPFFAKNGNGQKAFATKKEILSGCSPIR